MHNTSFLSPAPHPQIGMETRLFVVSFASFTTRWIPLCFSRWGAVCSPSRTRRQSESWGTWVRESVCACVHLLFLQMSSDYRYSFWIHVLIFSLFFCSCVCKTAHLCLRTRIGCTAIETLTLFLERVRPVSVLSTASVKYACLYRIYFSFGLGVIHRKVNPSLFSWGVITLPFVSSRTCEWKVSSFWLWKKKNNYSILMCTCTERCMKC